MLMKTNVLSPREIVAKVARTDEHAACEAELAGLREKTDAATNKLMALKERQGKATIPDVRLDREIEDISISLQEIKVRQGHIRAALFQHRENYTNRVVGVLRQTRVDAAKRLIEILDDAGADMHEAAAVLNETSALIHANASGPTSIVAIPPIAFTDLRQRLNLIITGDGGWR